MFQFNKGHWESYLRILSIKTLWNNFDGHCLPSSQKRRFTIHDQQEALKHHNLAVWERKSDTKKTLKSSSVLFLLPKTPKTVIYKDPPQNNYLFNITYTRLDKTHSLTWTLSYKLCRVITPHISPWSFTQPSKTISINRRKMKFWIEQKEKAFNIERN